MNHGTYRGVVLGSIQRVTPEQEQVILGLVHAPNRPPTTRPEDVLRCFNTEDGSALGLTLLSEAADHNDSDEVEFALLVCETFGFTSDHLPSLLVLAGADWHVSHENVVWYLGRFQSPEVVDALYRTTQWVPGYLDFDDNRALAKKAIRALGNQQTQKARDVLRQLADSDDELLRREARQQLER
jgi:hypothetical protein